MHYNQQSKINTMKPVIIKAICISLLCYSLHFYAQTTVNLIPSKDNSIYSESNNSNGQGHLFSGRTDGRGGAPSNRRALITFDITSIPNEATITNVTLTVNVNKVPPGSSAQTFNIHALTKDWGEGTSSGSGRGATAVAPDATWSDAILGASSWTSPGGDFTSTALSSLNINATGSYIFPSSTNFVTIVQQWIDNTSTNNGIILIGNESSNGSARRFGSKDMGIAPSLNITYNILSTNDFALKSFSISPNPSIDYIDIKLKTPLQDATITIYDLLGKKIHFNKINNDNRVNISKLTKGVYLLKITSQGNTKTKRFIKL